MTQKVQELEDEVARLRNRVLELESERDPDHTDPDHKQHHHREKSSKPRHRRITNRAAEEGSGLFRAFALAGVEAIRATGSVMSSFADTVSQRNRIEEKDSRDDLTRDLPNDVYTGVRNALDHVLDVPDRVLDKLHDGYREYKDSKDDSDDTKETDTPKQTGRGMEGARNRVVS